MDPRLCSNCPALSLLHGSRDLSLLADDLVRELGIGLHEWFHIQELPGVLLFCHWARGLLHWPKPGSMPSFHPTSPETKPGPLSFIMLWVLFPSRALSAVPDYRFRRYLFRYSLFQSQKSFVFFFNLRVLLITMMGKYKQRLPHEKTSYRKHSCDDFSVSVMV